MARKSAPKKDPDTTLVQDEDDEDLGQVEALVRQLEKEKKKKKPGVAKTSSTKVAGAIAKERKTLSSVIEDMKSRMLESNAKLKEKKTFLVADEDLLEVQIAEENDKVLAQIDTLTKVCDDLIDVFENHDTELKAIESELDKEIKENLGTFKHTLEEDGTKRIRALQTAHDTKALSKWKKTVQ